MRLGWELSLASDRQCVTDSPDLFTQGFFNGMITVVYDRYLYAGLSLWLIGTVPAEPETVISRAWVQSPDPAE